MSGWKPKEVWPKIAVEPKLFEEIVKEAEEQKKQRWEIIKGWKEVSKGAVVTVKKTVAKLSEEEEAYGGREHR